jgi:hypothetical protein
MVKKRNFSGTKRLIFVRKGINNVPNQPSPPSTTHHPNHTLLRSIQWSFVVFRLLSLRHCFFLSFSAISPEALSISFIHHTHPFFFSLSLSLALSLSSFSPIGLPSLVISNPN